MPSRTSVPGRIRVANLEQGSPHSCLSIAKWQWQLWSRQIANLYDRIRCKGEADPTLKQSLILTV